jgi:glycerol-3-phosphate dehydrogenase (NAD(P)+)
MSSIAIIGAGSWGTAIAVALAGLGHSVRLWAHEESVVKSIRTHRENRVFLPGVILTETILPTNSLAEALNGAKFVVTAMPSHVCRSMYTHMVSSLREEMILVSATKGLEVDHLMRISEVIQSVTEPYFAARLAVLSGPSFAQEVARGEPTAVVVASHSQNAAQSVQEEFSSRSLRLYTSDDVVGVELGGAVKNVIAIAAGVIEGLGLGHNPKAALITRGLAEMARLAVACGARAETLAGLTGMGDLVLTCTGDLSRNRSVGVELGKGRSLSDILGSMCMVAEGVKTAHATVALAKRHGVEMPITQQVYRILEGKISPRDAIRELMERTLKTEQQ